MFEIGDKVAVLNDTMKGIVKNVTVNEILIEEENGFELSFSPKELVKIVHEQSELSKYSDINNSLLRQKLQSVSKSKNKKGQKLSRKEKVHHAVMEVDLHIQHLVKSYSRMSNFEILTIQLDTAKHKIELALRKRIPRIVFIHGVGEGVLQKELEYLYAKYPVKYYDASYQKYGMGATEVYFLQK